MGILDQLKVLDLSEEKGLLCSKILADMGADVVRVDRPGLSPARTFANAGKHSISLDIRTLKGRDLFLRLVKGSSAVIESFDPGYLSSLGLGYRELSGLNPQLIMASITAYGQTGPLRNFKSSDLVASALGGQAFLCGDPDRPPLKPFGPQAYYTACLFAANGVLLALWQLTASGRGQHIDISVHECVAATLDQALVRYFYEGEVTRRQGSLSWNQAFRIFPCRDGYILLSPFQQWETLIEWLGSENMADDLKDPKYLDAAERRKDLDHIIEVLERWTLSHTADELVELGQLMHFPWARVDSIPDVVNSPQLKERGFFRDGFDPDSGRSYRFPGPPLRMSLTPWNASPHIPQAGEDNLEIFHHRLGLAEAEIAALRKEGVI